MADKFNFNQMRLNLVKKDMSLALANTVRNDALLNFRQQGFNGTKWQEVKRRIPGTYWYNRGTRSDRTRAILQGRGSGRLRKDVANSVVAGRKNSNTSYTLVVSNPYAEYHNTGTNILPQRQFIGRNSRLDKAILRKINQLIMESWAT